MEINSISNFTPNTNQNPAFTSFKMLSGASDTLKKVLKPEEWKEFQKIIEHQAENENVDILLFGRYKSKKLDGRLVQNSTKFMEQMKDYSQGWFEKTMPFIKRMSKNADELTAKINKVKDINPDEILNDAKPF